MSARTAVILLALLNIGLHLLVAPNLEYHRDELLYFSLGTMPAAGYASVPPLIACLAAGVEVLFGSSVLAVKLLPAVLGGVFTLLMARLARAFGGGDYAQMLAAFIPLIAPVFLRTFHLFQPVHLDLLVWTGLTLLALRFMATDEGRYLIYLGLLAGVGLLTKYLVVLWLLGLLLGLAIQRPAALRRRELYVGIGLALLVASPNLWWQLSRDFPVFAHMEALREGQLVNVSRGGFLLDQLLMAGATAPVLLTGLWSLTRRSDLRWLLVAVTFVLFVLLVLRGKSYYTLGVFPALLALGAVRWEYWLRGTAIRWAAPALLLVATLPLLPIGLPVVPAGGLINYFAALERHTGLTLGRRYEDGSVRALPQDYADQLGWQELVSETAEAYRRETNPTSVYLYCENYGQAAAMTVIGRDLGLPPAISFSDAFNARVPHRFDPPLEVMYYTNDELGADVDALFAHKQIVARIDQAYAREAGTAVWRLSEPHKPFREFWDPIVADMPSPY